MSKCPECGGVNHRLSEFWCDPSSGELSASRLVFLIVNLVFLPSLVYLAIVFGLSFGKVVELILGLNAAPTFVYGLNSVAGAWNRFKEDKPQPPKNGVMG